MSKLLSPGVRLYRPTNPPSFREPRYFPRMGAAWAFLLNPHVKDEGSETATAATQIERSIQERPEVEPGTIGGRSRNLGPTFHTCRTQNNQRSIQDRPQVDRRSNPDRPEDDQGPNAGQSRNGGRKFAPTFPTFSNPSFAPPGAIAAGAGTGGISPAQTIGFASRKRITSSGPGSIAV